MDAHRYIIFGPQGSGKGTQAELLVKELNIPHIATGELFRSEVAKGTALGKRIGADMAAGKLMPDSDADALVAAALKEQGAHGYILDGYPRTTAQAQYLDSIAPPTQVILLEVDDEESVRRISGRCICPNDKHIYHLDFNPPQQSNICDLCGATLIIRPDDYEEPVRARLKLYHELTEPLIEYYASQGKLERVNAIGSVDDIHQALRKALHLS